MPRIDDMLHTSGKAALFSSIDLQWGYWLIPLRVENRPKMAFITPFGLWPSGSSTQEKLFNALPTAYVPFWHDYAYSATSLTTPCSPRYFCTNRGVT